MSSPQLPPGNSAVINVRPALEADLDFLVDLERQCFAVHRQSTRRSMANSLRSSTQRVYVAEVAAADGPAELAGSAVAFVYKRTLRIYSIAVCPRHRRMGVGEALLGELMALAEQLHCEKITLEADAANAALVSWYQKFGFEVTRLLENYYMPGESAYRMVRYVCEAGAPAAAGEGLVLVVDESTRPLQAITDIPVIAARDYLAESRFSSSSRYHVLNLCNSYRTHSMGYYVSLLAAARNHRITPSVMTVKDISNAPIAQSLLDEIKGFVAERLKGVKKNIFELTVIMGRTLTPQFSDLGRKLFSLFEIPFFTLTLERRDHWRVKKIQLLHLKQVISDWADILQQALTAYQEKKRYRRTRLRNYKYDLAILVNESEPTPPSCAKALEQFRKAGEDAGFFVEFITRADHRRICEFDALFIRETTALDNHTYAIARHAYTEGLVVIDDPWSILLCSNKVYLYERLSGAGIRQPQGWLLTKKSCNDAMVQSLKYPVVLKLPESSFSMGVFRVNTPAELKEKAAAMFTRSDLIIAQEFLTSDYDWRIGVLDNRPLFACKYYMADGHWQIYNWQSADATEFSGRHETVEVNQVPADILKAAVKASSLIGDGLYGVDLKEVGRKAYVIEVNDNPNIDVGVEDSLLGDELYRRIMNSIYNRIEAERNQVRYLR